MNKKSKTYFLLQTQLSPRHLDIAIGILYRLGITTFEEKRLGGALVLRAKIQGPKHFRKIPPNIRKIEKELLSERIFQKIRIKKVGLGSWARSYQKYLRPFVLIRSENHKTISIRIDPQGKNPKTPRSDTLYIKSSLAFGTGTHATTRLCAEQLYRILLKNPRSTVLDVGCGTGILAMIAKRLGAKTVYAIDNDPEALEVAKKNFSENHIRGIVLRKSLKGLPKKFSIIVANIGLNTLGELHDDLIKHLRDGGDLILSGLLYRDFREILKFYDDFTLIERCNKKGWLALHLKKIGR